MSRSACSWWGQVHRFKCLFMCKACAGIILTYTFILPPVLHVCIMARCRVVTSSEPHALLCCDTIVSHSASQSHMQCCVALQLPAVHSWHAWCSLSQHLAGNQLQVSLSAVKCMVTIKTTLR
jgi:hypothetical protein